MKRNRLPSVALSSLLPLLFSLFSLFAPPPAAAGPIEDALDGGVGTFQQGGTGSWSLVNFPTFDGIDSARGPQISNGQTTSLSLDVAGPGVVSFWWKVEADAGPGFPFVANSTLDAAQIGFFTGFVPGSLRIPPGSSTVTWEYRQLSNPGGGIANRAWLDEVRFLPEVKRRPAAVAASDQFGAHVVVSGHLAAAASRKGVDLFDLANPAAPIARGFFPLLGAPPVLALEGNLLVVGDVEDDDLGVQTGAVHLVDTSIPNFPVLLRKLHAPEAPAYRSFGDSVSLCGNLLLVGAPGEAPNSSFAGAAYLYDVSDPANPVLLSTLGGSGLINDFFGEEVELHGTLAAVVGREGNASSPISVRLFDLSDPAAPRQTHLFGGQAAGSFYGANALSLRDGLLAIGDVRADDLAESSGAIDLFDVSDPDSPVLLKRLVAPDGGFAGFFGRAVELSGGFLHAGAFGGLNGAGSSYLFDIANPANPLLRAKLSAHDRESLDQFGFGAAISGKRIAAGAVGDDIEAGSLYFYTMPWIEEFAELCPGGPPVPYSGDTFPLRISVGGPWTAASDSPWAAVDTAAGTGNGEIRITVAPNRSTSERVALVTVSGATHRIRQLAAPRAPRIVAPRTVTARGSRAAASVRVVSTLPVKIAAKANAGARTRVVGRNPFRVTVTKLKKKSTRVSLAATDILGRTAQGGFRVSLRKKRR